MAEGRKGEKSDPTREARIKTDHELFIEAYESESKNEKTSKEVSSTRKEREAERESEID